MKELPKKGPLRTRNLCDVDFALFLNMRSVISESLKKRGTQILEGSDVVYSIMTHEGSDYIFPKGILVAHGGEIELLKHPKTQEHLHKIDEALAVLIDPNLTRDMGYVQQAGLNFLAESAELASHSMELSDSKPYLVLPPHVQTQFTIADIYAGSPDGNFSYSSLVFTEGQMVGIRSESSDAMYRNLSGGHNRRFIATLWQPPTNYELQGNGADFRVQYTGSVSVCDSRTLPEWGINRKVARVKSSDVKILEQATSPFFRK